VHDAGTAAVAAAIGSAGGPVVGLVAGVVAAFAVDEGVKYGERQIEQNVQNAVARTAGPLEVGKSADWRVVEDLPLTSRYGTVEVARRFGDKIACKDVVFTVGDQKEFFTTTVCQDKEGIWRWASAEPNTHRWGALQ
jgi:hypothetical protein